MNESLLNRIRQDIEKTGFITELKVASILYKHNWHVSHSRSYEDFDLQKSREIDIDATKNYNHKEANFYSEFRLIVEVKKIDKKPWVIFTTPHVYKGWGWRILHSGWNYTSKKRGIFDSEILDKKTPSI